MSPFLCQSPSSSRALTNARHRRAADLPGHFFVWLASPEATFLKGKFVWANWDAEELLERAEEIKNAKLLSMVLDGVDG